MQDFTHYTAIDFALDQDFQAWVLRPSEKQERFWNEVISLYPQHRKTMQQARAMLQSLEFSMIPESEIPKERLLAAIDERIDREIDTSRTAIPMGNSKRRIMSRSQWQVAASIVILIGFAVGYLVWLQFQTIQLETSYGETRTISLPDHSHVTLNANSSLSYSSDWQDQLVREVWLEGEAFFQVERLAETGESGVYKKFIVHTETVDIEVLGTEFNVYQTEGKAQVVLTKGKVKVSSSETSESQEIYLNPGELAEYSADDRQLAKKAVDPEPYTKWQENQLIFEDVSFQEVARRLKEIYGYSIIWEDASSDTLRFDGVVPANDLDAVIDILEGVYGVTIHQDGRKLRIK